ncbi:MAG: potassium-transporting ATPase subunit KdpA [Phycisphaerales bacterium]
MMLASSLAVSVPAIGWLQLVLFLVVVLACAKPLGLYMARVFEGRASGAATLWIERVWGPIERLIYRLAGVKQGEAGETGWKAYAAAMLVFNVLGIAVVYVLQRWQGSLPLNPQAFGDVEPGSAMNTAVSFVTNTNWQGYGGETAMSSGTQMLALAVQNFLSAATGLAVVIALTRGIARRSARVIGNFWIDVTRGTLYVLLPLSLIMAVVMVSQGVVQTFKPYQTVTLTEPLSYDTPVLNEKGEPVKNADGTAKVTTTAVTTQSIPLGPVASQIAIKQLGTNGGGFFNANAAHPLENPTPLSNFIQTVAIFLIPGALCITFGQMVRDRRQGWAILAAMTVIFVGMAVFCMSAEQAGNPTMNPLGIDQSAGNMEGKETRFGSPTTALFATATTSASCGAVNGMHDSFTPLGGLVPMWLIQLGEVVFGGVGAGLYGMLVFVIVCVFVAGLMVGRTPEYIGKKIEPYEIKMASIAVLAPCAMILIGTAIACLSPAGPVGVSNPGPHGFSQMLYAVSSAAGNNGSAFAGLSANTPFWNTLLAVAMFVGRFFIIIPVLALAGSLAGKTAVPTSSGTLPTHTPLFVVLLICVVLVVGALTFVPALALGPIVEHLNLTAAH